MPIYIAIFDMFSLHCYQVWVSYSPTKLPLFVSAHHVAHACLGKRGTKIT